MGMRAGNSQHIKCFCCVFAKDTRNILIHLRRIFGDVIVYNCLHWQTTFRTECITRLARIDYIHWESLWNLVSGEIFGFFGCTIRGEIGFQDLKNFDPRRTKGIQYIGHKFLEVLHRLLPFQYSEMTLLKPHQNPVSLMLLSKYRTQRFFSLFTVDCFERIYVCSFGVLNVFVVCWCCRCLGKGLSHLKTLGSVNCSQRSQNSQNPENSHHRKLRVPEETQQTHNVMKTRYHAMKQHALTFFRSALKRQISQFNWNS